MKKKILITVIALLVLYAVFVTVDCIRLKNSATDTKPIITLSEPDYDRGTKYVGLGYSIAYYKDPYIDENGNICLLPCGAEFRLFDKFLIWAWIE